MLITCELATETSITEIAALHATVTELQTEIGKQIRSTRSAGDAGLRQQQWMKEGYESWEQYCEPEISTSQGLGHSGPQQNNSTAGCSGVEYAVADVLSMWTLPTSPPSWTPQPPWTALCVERVTIDGAPEFDRKRASVDLTVREDVWEASDKLITKVQPRSDPRKNTQRVVAGYHEEQ